MNANHPDFPSLPGPDSWLDVARNRLRETARLWGDTSIYQIGLEDLLDCLSDELRREMADEPCPRRMPAVWAEWRQDCRDLHAARRLVRQSLRVVAQAPAMARAA